MLPTWSGNGVAKQMDALAVTHIRSEDPGAPLTPTLALRVLIALIPVDPALAIDYALAIPAPVDLVKHVRSWRDDESKLPADHDTLYLIEEALEWLAQQ
jgi:hypothetical protein